MSSQNIMLFNNKIEGSAIVSNETASQMSVIPAGRHRNNYVLHLTNLISSMVGESRPSFSKVGKWIMERVTASRIKQVIQLLAPGYVSASLTAVIDICTTIEKAGPFSTLTAEDMTAIMNGVLDLISKLKRDLPDRMISSMLWHGGVGNTISLQIPDKALGCNPCLDVKVQRIINEVVKSDARKAYAVESSITTLATKEAAYATADTLMTQKFEAMPLEYIRRNATECEQAMATYDASRFLMPISSWHMTNCGDAIEDVLVKLKTIPVNPTTTTATSTVTSSSTTTTYTYPKTFGELLRSGITDLTFSTTTRPSVLSVAPQMTKTVKKVDINEKIDQYMEVLYDSGLSPSAQKELKNMRKEVAPYCFITDPEFRMPPALCVKLKRILSKEIDAFSKEDITMLFGSAFAESLVSSTLYKSENWDAWYSDDYVEKYGDPFVMFSTSSVKDKTADNIKDYSIYTTIHKRGIFNVECGKFTKIFTVFDDSDEKLTVLKIQPGGSRTFYCKYLGIKTSELEAVTSLKLKVRFIDMGKCEDLKFIDFLTKFDVKLDSSKLDDYNGKLKQVIGRSPTVEVDDIDSISKSLDVIRCIQANMWFNDITNPLRPYVAHLDRYYRDERVLTIVRYLNAPLADALQVNGSSAFINGAYIPQNVEEGMALWLLQLIVTIPDVIRQGILGTSSERKSVDIVRDMSITWDHLTR